MKRTAWKMFAGLGAVLALGAAGCASNSPEWVTPGAPMGAPAPAPVSRSSPPRSGFEGRAAAPADAAPAPPPSQPNIFDDRAARRTDTSPGERPGLGTEWGETRNSHVSMVSFLRADRSSPFATAQLYYNDEEGAHAMARSSGYKQWTGGTFTISGGYVSVGLRDDRGSFLPGFMAGGRSYAVGEAGSRYVIVVRNNTNVRLEAVLSVDGLDVLDGESASFGKRGYILEPRSELEVDGFRRSVDAVAAFRFGSVRDSYANLKTGDSRNVGVVGIALFNEAGTSPAPWNQDEVDRRHDANAFPGGFATPPW